jgi:hypothetical protein
MREAAGAHGRPIHDQLSLRSDILSHALEGPTRQLDAHLPAEGFGKLSPPRQHLVGWS